MNVQLPVFKKYGLRNYFFVLLCQSFLEKYEMLHFMIEQHKSDMESQVVYGTFQLQDIGPYSPNF